MVRKAKKVGSHQRLAKGQLWRLSNAYIQIVELGKRLIHYKMMSDPEDTWARTQMSSIETMWVYLKTRHARLVKTGSPG
jgi:hypothetical protein